MRRSNPMAFVGPHQVEPDSELMFADPEQQAKATRDPVAPAKRSAAALAKVPCGPA